MDAQALSLLLKGLRDISDKLVLIQAQIDLIRDAPIWDRRADAGTAVLIGTN
jgi:hypothetical protein